MNPIGWRLIRVLVVVALSGTCLMAAQGVADASGSGTMYRSCGTNYLESGAMTGGSFASTDKASGTCAGRLSVAIRHLGGVVGPRKYGTNTYAVDSTGLSIAGGRHWGCDDCGYQDT